MKYLRRSAGVVTAVSLLTFGMVAPAIAADPPDITSVVSRNKTIKQDFQKNFNVEVIGFEDGGTFEVSGEGVELIIPNGGIKPSATENQWRIKLEAAADAPVGLRDLTVINPDGQSDTLFDAIEVLPNEIEPDTGIAGHVFVDLNADGVKDGSEVGLSGVAVSVVDSEGAMVQTITDGSGDYVLTGLADGDGTVTYETPTDHTLTTGNDVQVVTVFSATIASSVDVGYEPPEVVPADVTIIGFANADANISQAETRSYRVDVTGADAAAVWSFSGDGVVVDRSVLRGDSVRLTVIADATASLGLRDLTVVNPDGSTDTLVGGLEVVGS